jgi:two-component system sensor histidine kinase UhpB
VGLRTRLNLLLTVIFCLALSVAVVHLLASARRAVVDELRASTELASTLMRGLIDTRAARDDRALAAIAARLQHDHAIRHLRIGFAPAAGPHPQAVAPRPHPAGAPRWFAALVQPDPGSLTRRLPVDGGAIVVAADPDDEIAEAWRETRGTLALLLAVFVGANAVAWVFLGRALLPLQDLSVALQGIEHGRFAARLRPHGLPDIDRIAERFNHMAEALERSHAENLMLAQRSLAIQEEERRYLAHELHDEMGQSITAIKALAVSIRERAEGSDPTLAERADTITDVSSDIYARVRGMMARLHPVILDELGLVAAIEMMVDDWNAHHADCFCRLVAARQLPPLADATRIGVYRIVQEALTNVARHAAASEVEVRIGAASTDSGTSCIVVDIADNGVGFDGEQPRRGLGLLGIQERVRAMNGALEISGAPGAGVRIRVRATLDPAPAAAAETAGA